MTSDEIYKLIEDNGLALHGDIEHFAALVASAEREACARVCSEMYLEGDMDTGIAAEAIRARGQA